jgi:hypothetical protein
LTLAAFLTLAQCSQLPIDNRRRLYCDEFESLLSFFFGVGLLAWFERQRFGELNRNSADEPVHLVDPADMTAASEICHVEGVVLAESRHAETRGYVLAGVRTIIVGVAGKRRAIAGDINHLALGKCFVKVVGEPDRPTITQSLLFSSLSIFVHSKYPKNTLPLLANRQIQGQTLRTIAEKIIAGRVGRAGRPVLGL